MSDTGGTEQLMVTAFIRDDRGFVVSIELVLIATIALIGLLAGLSSVRDGLVSEISDVAGGVQDFNQSYRLFGVLGNSGSTAGADFRDRNDFCDSDDDPSATAPDNCVTIFRRNESTEEGTAISAP